MALKGHIINNQLDSTKPTALVLTIKNKETETHASETPKKTQKKLALAKINIKLTKPGNITSGTGNGTRLFVYM